MFKSKWLILMLMVVFSFALIFGGCAPEEEAVEPEEDVADPEEEAPEPEEELEEGPVVFVSWGGSWQDMIEDIVLEPFSEEYGVEFRSVSPTDYGKLRSMVEAGHVEWDAVDVGGGAPVRLADHLQPLDFDIIDTEGIDDDYIVADGLGIGWNTYSNVLGWNTDELGEEGPQDWADFWDVEKFPGPRAMINETTANLEIALLADGMDKDEIYPLDDEKIDRAYEKLDEIKDHVAVWWDSAAEPAQLLADGEVVMASAWDGRLNTVIEEGASVDYTYNQGLLHFGSVVVPKDAPNRNLAMHLVNYLCKPEIQAKIGEEFGYGGTNQKAFDYMDEEVAEDLNTAPHNFEKQLIYDEAFWGGEQREALEERWNEWILE